VAILRLRIAVCRCQRVPFRVLRVEDTPSTVQRPSYAWSPYALKELPPSHLAVFLPFLLYLDPHFLRWRDNERRPSRQKEI
jgi:hypothetical protein